MSLVICRYSKYGARGREREAAGRVKLINLDEKNEFSEEAFFFLPGTILLSTQEPTAFLSHSLLPFPVDQRCTYLEIYPRDILESFLERRFAIPRGKTCECDLGEQRAVFWIEYLQA